MNNKETLQNYNTRLNTNNNDLNSILETVNNLPTSSGGSGSSFNTVGGLFNESAGNILVAIERESGFIEDKASYNLVFYFEDGSKIEETVSVISYEQLVGYECYVGEGVNSAIQVLPMTEFIPNGPENMQALMFGCKTEIPMLGTITKL